MAKLTDIQIKAWIKAGERFEGRSDGNGLYLRYRAGDRVPVWRFRYQFAGKSRVMLIGSYSEISLAKARETARELSARVALGFDVAGEKQERKAAAIEKIEQEKMHSGCQTRNRVFRTVDYGTLEASRSSASENRQGYKPAYWQHESRGREAPPYRCDVAERC